MIIMLGKTLQSTISEKGPDDNNNPRWNINFKIDGHHQVLTIFDDDWFVETSISILTALCKRSQGRWKNENHRHEDDFNDWRRDQMPLLRNAQGKLTKVSQSAVESRSRSSGPLSLLSQRRNEHSWVRGVDGEGNRRGGEIWLSSGHDVAAINQLM